MALYFLLQVAYELEKFDVAEKYYRKYLELHPADTEMLFALAGIYYRTGRTDMVRETIDTILLFKPEHKNALELLKKLEAGFARAG